VRRFGCLDQWGILEKALGMIGLGDIELESDEFNRRFALRSLDRRFAVTLVAGSSSISWMLWPSTEIPCRATP